MYPFAPSVFPLLPLEIFALFVLLNLFQRASAPSFFRFVFLQASALLVSLFAFPTPSGPSVFLRPFSGGLDSLCLSDVLTCFGFSIALSGGLASRGFSKPFSGGLYSLDFSTASLRVDWAALPDPALPAPHA